MRLEMLLPRWLYERERLVVCYQRRLRYSGHISIKFASGVEAFLGIEQHCDLMIP